MLEKDLPKHLYIEFRYGNYPNGDKMLFESSWKNKLWEEHGIVNNMDSYVDTIYSIVEKNINKLKSIYKSQAKFTYNEIITEKDFEFETFFDTINIPIYLSIDLKSKSCQHGGSYLSGKSGWNNGSYHVQIGHITADGNPDLILRFLRADIAHELTHAYEDYCRRNNNAEDLWTNSKKRGQFIATNMASKKNALKYENEIGIFLYFINNVEINAYIGELKEELIPYFKSINNSEDAFNAIKQTEVYRGIKKIESTFDGLKILNLKKEPIYDNIKQEILNLFNKTRQKDDIDKQFVSNGSNPTPVNTFNQFFKIVEKKYNRLINRFLVQSSKIAYDLYKKYGDIGTDAGIVRKN